MTQKDHLNWGLLSTARINRALIPPLKKSEHNHLVAVASRDLERAQKYAAEKQIPRAFGSYEALLADPDIDVIYNALPNHLHAEWTIKAARAGKHVLCEKPIGLSVDEVDAIAQAAQDNHVKIAEAFMYRHHPQTKHALALMRSGEIGELVSLHGSFTYTIDDEHQDDIRLVPEYGGGSIWDVGCYSISYFRTMTGSAPVEVFGWQRSSRRGVDLTFLGEMRYSDQVIGQFESSFELPDKSFIEVRGSKGSIYIPTPFKPRDKATFQVIKDGNIDNITMGNFDLYSGEIDDMYDAVVKGRPQLIPLSESRENIATILAFLEAADKDQPVKLKG